LGRAGQDKKVVKKFCAVSPPKISFELHKKILTHFQGWITDLAIPIAKVQWNLPKVDTSITSIKRYLERMDF